MDIKPSEKSSKPSKTGPTTTEPSTFQKVTTTEETRRGTAPLFNSIDELKDNRGFAHKSFGFLIQDLDAKALSENFAEVKNHFKQYQQFGITIPKDLSNFELNDGSPVLGSPAYITEAQAELKTLASKGEALREND